MFNKSLRELDKEEFYMDNDHIIKYSSYSTNNILKRIMKDFYFISNGSFKIFKTDYLFIFEW